MTLTEFLEFSFTSDFKLINQIDNLDGIQIEYISILEPPAGSFVRKNELILSAAFSIKDDVDALHDFIYSVYSMGASGIVLSFPENDFHILEPLLDEFSSYHFPILSMDYYHLFQDVVESTLRELWNKNNASISVFESLQRSLLSYYIHENTMDDAAELISAMLNTDVIIMDDDHQILARNEAIRKLSPEGILIHRTSELFRLPITSHNLPVGVIILDDTPLTQLLRNEEYVQYLLTPLSLWFEKTYLTISSKVREKETFILQLTNGNYQSVDELYTLAHNVSVHSDINYCCFAGELTYPSSAESFIQDAIIATAQERKLEAMALCKKKRCIIFLECPNHAMTQEDARNFLDDLEQRMEKQLSVTNFLWGYNLKASPLEDLMENYQKSAEALKVCIESGGKLKRYSVTQSMLNRVKTLLSSDAEISVSAQRILAPLIHMDETKSTEYIQTLRQYIQSNYNVTNAAEKLSVHRQTMIYRLTKIEEYCQISLTSHEDLLLLELSLLSLQ